MCLGGFAEIESLQGCRGGSERAATLYGVAHNLRQSVASAADSLVRWSEHERTTALLRARIDRVKWDSAWAEGLGLDVEQAIAFALEGNGPPGSS